MRKVFNYFEESWRNGFIYEGLVRIWGLFGSILGSGITTGERKWQPTPVFLPGQSHGQRSLAGYSPRGRKESDMTAHLSTHTLHYMIH